ncbi:aKG-HExxH-type peptide beta-hydroxylase [Bradyrhizobium sp. PUT101]|uniref:aKG-HExxH-type peptide beta-hydroxylase n=1 Tax=Bradyrhizobium sp. PUT101 TaxID=3447427 RepID=UPI003F860671
MIIPQSAESSSGELSGHRESLYRGFSFPGAPLHAELFRAVTEEWTREVLRVLIERMHEHQSSNSLRTYLKQASQGRNLGTFALDPNCGAAHEALSGNTELVDRAACGAGLMLAAAGEIGDWNVNLTSPTRFRFGHWLLPAATRFIVHVDSERTCINVGPHTFSVQRDNVETADAIELPTVHAGARRIVCWNRNVGRATEVAILSRQFRNRLRGDLPDRVQSAFDLLSRAAPEYYEWVSRVVRVIFLLECRGRLLESASFASRPGVLRITADTRPAAVAEMLVHEASHQYYYLLTRLGFALSNAEDTQYSPLKRTERPLDKIILGFHAFGNVLLLHRQLRERHADDDGYCAETLQPTHAEVTMMRDTIRLHAQLTDIGRGLCYPLSAALS